MPQQEQKKDHSFFYLISTLAFIVIGIILTAIINKTTSHDIRSRASTTNGITATAIVADVGYETNTLTVSQLVFSSSPQKDMGNWTVKLPPSINASTLTVGTKVQLTIDPTIMSITEHTLTAKDVKKK